MILEGPLLPFKYTSWSVYKREMDNIVQQTLSHSPEKQTSDQIYSELKELQAEAEKENGIVSRLYRDVMMHFGDYFLESFTQL